MIPNEWLEYIRDAEREQSARPENAPKKPQGVGKGSGGRRLMSRRQATAFRQSPNAVRASYVSEVKQNLTPIINPKKGNFVTNLGGNCEPQTFTGKNTSPRGRELQSSIKHHR